MSCSWTGVSISPRSGHLSTLPVMFSWSACSQGATEAVRSVASRITCSAELPGAIVTMKQGSPAEQTIRDATDLTASVAPWLQADHEGLTGKVLKWPERAEIDTPVQESLIVELYSK